MRRSVRPVLLLLAILSLMAGGAYVAITRTTRGWFEADLQLRSKLAVLSARQSLLQHWAADPKGLQATLADITRDERIMAAAACSEAGDLVAATTDYPRSFSCRSVFERLAQELGPTAKRGAFGAELPSGRVQVNVHRLLPDATTTDNDVVSMGRVVLVHDLGVFERREATTRNVILLGFLFVAIAAAGLTLLMTRLTWRDWNEGLRRALTGNENGNGEFAPLLGDVRNLVERLSREPDSEVRGLWSPERLRATLHQHLEGERVVLLANREPYIHERTGDTIRVMHPASGLVSALEPVMRACSGVWVAHGSGSADRETVDAHDRVRVPPGETTDTYLVRRVWLSEAEESGYYYGFSNEGLWPLCHVAHTRPLFRADDWAQYVAVNRKFADAVCREVDTDDPIVLVQDYHFALAPKMIRERLPKATIITFWHIPWPNAERIGICPWRDELITGLLGSSIVGFHTQQHCNNFRDAVDMYIESRIDREHNAVTQGDRRTLIRPYPISVEWPIHWLLGLPTVEECRRQVRAELGLAADATIGVGIDRLDYTKGIEERLRAVDELLTHHPEHRGKFTFVQLAAPSRTKIAHYHDLNLRIEQVAAEINAKWASGSYRPILLLRAHHEPPTVFRYYRAAELCYVSSLHDGMNLVAKEFVAARDDEHGVLVLSQFTGAARDLTEALIVNPYDVREAGDAMAAALRMPDDEQRVRMQSMRRLVAQFNVYRWAGRMLVDAAELRRRERTAARLTERIGEVAARGDVRRRPA